MQIRRLTAEGVGVLRAWLSAAEGEQPPQILLDGDLSEPWLEEAVDLQRVFDSRFSFGMYLADVLQHHRLTDLMLPEHDEMWAWLAVAYFGQLRKRNRKTGKFQGSEHFIVERRGLKGSLAYRQAPRTAYELAVVHGDAARICLAKPMDTFGDMAEQLASRTYLARNRGFIRAAAQLYVRKGEVVRGASTYPVKPSKRKQGDRKGYGGLRRLEQRLAKLDLTYDAAALSAEQIVELLPREFEKYKPQASG